MGVRCFLIEVTPEGRFRNPATGQEEERANRFGPGAMWWGSYPMNWESRESYPEEDRRERTVWVILPNGGGAFCLDQRETRIEGNRIVHGTHWQWSGEPPDVTVAPSINANPAWHGHLRNGTFTT